MSKTLPNILITGTPGCGKTQHAARLKELLEFKFFNISDIVKERHYYSTFDEDFQSYIVDEDKVLDDLEEPIAQGCCVVDHHTCDFFPERFFQLVVVLRTNNTILYDRLKARGYNQLKLQENMEAEIMGVVSEQAEESYSSDTVVELASDTPEQLENNCERILQWISIYMLNDAEENDE